MKKILIFGCSFSAGSHRLKTENDNSSNADVYIPKSKGWYHYVDYFKNKEITVISTPGQGYWSWYQILLMLDQTNQLKYDEIWIQETTEPRVVILDLKQTEKLIKDKDYGFYVENIYIKRLDFARISSVRISRPADKHESFSNKINAGNIRRVKIDANHCGIDLAFINPYNFYEEVTDNIVKNAQNILKNNEIKSYVWSMIEPCMKVKEEDYYVTRLSNLYNVRAVLNNSSGISKKNNLLTIARVGHATEEGNKYIGKLINKACIDMKI